MGAGFSAADNSREAAIIAANHALDTMGHDESIKLGIVYANAQYGLDEVIDAIYFGC